MGLYSHLHDQPEPIMETTTVGHRVLNDPQLQDLPYKIEMNEHGQILLRRQKPQHGCRQSKVSGLLRDHGSQRGTPAVEFAVETKKG